MSDLPISDIIYALSFDLTRVRKDVLQSLYDTERHLFCSSLRQHFCSEYQKFILEKIEREGDFEIYDQEEVDKIFGEFAIFLHKYVNLSYFERARRTKPTREGLFCSQAHSAY